jgi:hypothetical protein
MSSHALFRFVVQPADDPAACDLLQSQLTCLIARCSSLTNEAGCTEHRAYYLGKQLRAVECGLCLRAGQRFLANASLNVTRKDCLWRALAPHLQDYHRLRVSKAKEVRCSLP